MQGRVNYWDETRGFGFITCDDGVDVFVHVKWLQPGIHSLAEGDRVSFDIKPGERGRPAAANVRPA